MPLAQVLDSGEIHGNELVGVHEQRHLVRFPNILNLVGEHSATVVTRYWGEEPDLRVTSHGEGIPLLGTDDCGRRSQPAGFTTAHANNSIGIDRARGGFSNIANMSDAPGGGLTPDEVARLDSYFGPATAVSVGPDDYVAAYALVLWRPALTFGAIGVIVYAIRSRILARMLGNDRVFDGPTAAAAFFGVTLVAIAIESFGFVDWLGLVAATAASIGMASILRVPWAILGVLFLGYNTFIREWFYTDLAAGDTRLHVGVGALVIGAGALVWSRGHWIRFLSSLTVLAGTFVFVLGAVEVRGYRNMTKAVALASIVTGAAGLAVWWLVYQERTLSSGAPAEPRDETARVD